MEKNLTTGSVFGNIVRFSLPYLLSYFLQTLYGMADLFIIGQYADASGTTAVSVGTSGHAHAHAHDRRPRHGRDGHDRAGRRRARPEARRALVPATR